jgi:hypothetical protein
MLKKHFKIKRSSTIEQKCAKNQLMAERLFGMVLVTVILTDRHSKVLMLDVIMQVTA